MTELISQKKFYIASSSKFMSDCEKMAYVLEEKYNGYITRKWWVDYIRDGPRFKDMPALEFYAHPQVQSVNTFDFEAIKEADYVIVLTSQADYKLTGALVELGYATALGKPVFVIGQLKRSAMFAHCIHFKNANEFFEIMNRGQFNSISEVKP